MFAFVRDAENKLLDTINGIESEANGWRAVYFRFDQLLEQYRSDYQIQISVNLLVDLLVNYQGGVFVCFDRTIILVCRNVSKTQIDKAIFQLRYLFMDDPLAYDNGGEENKNFCRIFDLGIEYPEFYQICRQKLSQSTRADKVETNKKPTRITNILSNVSEQLFTPSRLAHIELDLNKADLSRIIERQSICAITNDNKIRKVFDEYYIQISSLRQMLHSKTDFLSNRWLFRYLTKLLDERVMDLFSMSPMRYFDSPVAVNFNIETILSSKFKEFDALIKPLVKHSIIIEIQIGDVFIDISAFVAARNILNKLGYKICLDGVTNLSILQIDREKLGFDLAKLQWNADLEDDLGVEENKILMKAIKSFGEHRVILTRCDSRQAVNYGQAMGINLFQGRFIDKMLIPSP